jgi:hypothetical protein
MSFECICIQYIYIYIYIHINTYTHKYYTSTAAVTVDQSMASVLAARMIAYFMKRGKAMTRKERKTDKLYNNKVREETTDYGENRY